MGRASEPIAVVDPELKVLGLKELRIVDASVMPHLAGGNINAPVIMIAETDADLIRSRTALHRIAADTSACTVSWPGGASRKVGRLAALTSLN